MSQKRCCSAALPAVEPVAARSFTAANDEADEPEHKKDDGKNPQDMKGKTRPSHD